jgi:choice-of-anchor B domain-containing protein
MFRFFNPCFFILICFRFAAQTYPSYKIDLVSHLTPNNADMGTDNRRYSGCWGWHQPLKNKEYAISGTSNGTYFIDISSPATPTVCDFVQGKQGCTYREMKTYQNYCYIVSDDGYPTSLQIVDLQYLPDSVHLIYSGNQYFSSAHTIYIDGDKMYLGINYFPSAHASMAVYSLATPTAPVLLRKLDQDAGFISQVHDMFVRHDTVYASAAGQGLFVFKFDPSIPAFLQIGSLTGYSQAGYNHSSCLTDNGKFLVFCDEVPAGIPIRLADVENLSNIQIRQSFQPSALTTPHNPYVIGNKFALVSCYEDGLYIYDISDPNAPGRVGFFDTYPQAGLNTGTYSDMKWRGNWGCYPYLPSGLIIANDMQNGIFILDPTDAYNNPDKDPLAVSEISENRSSQVYPNPSAGKVHITSLDPLRLIDPSGKCVFTGTVPLNGDLDLTRFENGCYLLEISGKRGIHHEKFILNH